MGHALGPCRAPFGHCKLHGKFFPMERLWKVCKTGKFREPQLNTASEPAIKKRKKGETMVDYGKLDNRVSCFLSCSMAVASTVLLHATSCIHRIVARYPFVFQRHVFPHVSPWFLVYLLTCFRIRLIISPRTGGLWEVSKTYNSWKAERLSCIDSSAKLLLRAPFLFFFFEFFLVTASLPRLQRKPWKPQGCRLPPPRFLWAE